MMRPIAEQMICKGSKWSVINSSVTFKVVGFWCVGSGSNYSVNEVEIKVNHKEEIEIRSMDLFIALIEEGKIIRTN